MEQIRKVGGKQGANLKKVSDRKVKREAKEKENAKGGGGGGGPMDMLSEMQKVLSRRRQGE